MSDNGGTEYDHFKCVILINLQLDKLIKNKPEIHSVAYNMLKTRLYNKNT